VESLIKMEVKIAKAYIQQGFPDHVAGFYTYLGSIPSSQVECSYDTTKVVIEYYLLTLVQSFLILVQKTGQNFLRTVRKFWSGIFGGEIRVVYEVFGI
jgi:hypothetical protein